jgi:hypothetical protein
MLITFISRAAVACAIKTYYLPQVGTWTDFTYNTADTLIWALAEASITIVASSIPFLRLIVREVSSKSGSQSRSRTRTRTSGNRLSLVELTSGRKTKRGVGVEAQRKDDDGSEKSILAASLGQVGKIMQTSEVKIEYEENGYEAGNNMQYENHGREFYN